MAMRRLSFGSITHCTLTALCELLFIPAKVAYYATFHPRQFYGALGNVTLAGEWVALKEKRTSAKGLYYLKRQGFLTEHKNGFLALTPKARREVVGYQIQRKRKKEPWDGKWRLVVFDVPEATRRERDFLRMQLRDLGFYELQKSAWVFPHEFEKELREFLTLCRKDLHGDIRFATIERIDRDNDMRAFFRFGESVSE